ncbi:MAG: hypothetical protein ACPG3Z_03170 [Saprospiraceae bacterium]
MKSIEPRRTKGSETFFIYAVLTILFVLSVWAYVYKYNFTLEF